MTDSYCDPRHLEERLIEATDMLEHAFPLVDFQPDDYRFLFDYLSDPYSTTDEAVTAIVVELDLNHNPADDVPTAAQRNF